MNTHTSFLYTALAVVIIYTYMTFFRIDYFTTNVMKLKEAAKKDAAEKDRKKQIAAAKRKLKKINVKRVMEGKSIITSL